MSETQQAEIMSKRVVYRAPGMEAVKVQRDVEYRSTETGPLTVDFYYPPDSTCEAKNPAVIIVNGYAGPFNRIGWCISWSELLAASGLVAITYSTREPVRDVQTLLDYVRENSDSLGIDGKRIGVFSGSGNAPNALALLMDKGREYLKAAVLCYPFTIDAGDSTAVADAAKTYGFVNPCAGKSVDDLPKETPLFIVRAGQDHFPGINSALDQFVARALSRNLPITLVNYAEAVHGFDLFDESEKSLNMIRQMIDFMRFTLRA